MAELAFFIHGFLSGRFPLTEIAHLPYVFNRGRGTAAQVLSTSDASRPLTDLAPQLAGEHGGTQILSMVATPTLGLFLNTATVRSPADPRALRIRQNGAVALAMLEAWGSTPAAIVPAELADSLSNGTIASMIFNDDATK